MDKEDHVAIQQEGSPQQPIPYQPPPAGSTDGVAGQDVGSEFSQALEQQIAQAIQPVLEDFRQQMAQTLEHEIEQLPSGAAASAPPAPGAQSGQGLPGQVAQQAPTSALTGALQPTVNETLRPALEKAERQGEEWASALLVAALTALLTESTRRFIEQRAASGLHTLTQKLFEAAPAGVTTQDMPLKVETALQGILRDVLDALFAEDMRGVVRQGGQTAIQQTFRGDLGAAVGEVVDIVKRLADALLNVLRKEWPTLLRLALALALLALESSLMQSERSDPKAQTAGKEREKSKEISASTQSKDSAKDGKDSKGGKEETRDKAASQVKSAGQTRGAAREATTARSRQSKTSASTRSTSRASSASRSKDARDTKGSGEDQAS